MELSERIIATLEAAGFPSVFELSDPADTVSPDQLHSWAITLVVTDGFLEVKVAGNTRTLKTGDRIDIKAQTPYSVVTGAQGCNYVVGEK